MDDSLWSVVLIVGLSVLITYATYPREENRKRLRAWRAEEERTLAQLSIQVSDARYSVDGISAMTVERTEAISSTDNGQVVTFSATRFLRNPFGEYFMWVWRSGGKPYVKHVSQVNARVVLKRKYIPPRGGR